jgi:hypothetical protein
MSDNARPQTNVRITEAIRNSECGLLPHPSYSPGLALRDYHVVAALNIEGGKNLLGQHYANEKALQNAVLQWLQRRERNFYIVFLKDGRQSTQMEITLKNN